MTQAESDLPFDLAKLDRLAEVAVNVGLGLKEGQELIVTCPSTALPFLRRVVAAAYRAGASLVTPIISDAEITLARYRHAPDGSFDKAPAWLYAGMAEAFEAGAARMAIVADDPMLLADEEPGKVSRAGRANSAAYQPALAKIAGFDINWTIAAFPGQAWAKRMFPDVSAEEAQGKLADAIFAASRLENNDPVEAWAKHNAQLRSRCDWLNEQRFDALHYSGPGTDFTLGLAQDHKWKGGASEAKNGIICNPNIPTEEVFTTPDSRRADGTVRATKPLSHQGAMIEGIEVRFEGGRIVEATCTRGEEVFQELIATDEGASRLGEVALVPHSSPISASGLLYYNTLFDENASCHIAQGQCYSDCFIDGAKLSKEEIAEKGGNSSLIHVDWMIGSGEIDIDGIREDGTRVPVMRGGEWAS
ncbi:aminopeptidase [Pseudoroseicyclus tamaricis]|uniref:Aminopeptidase n=1 Tax=Pseudoroseicyclus tamaricis TaxID=2705421 RepID=A0A6B2K6I2_9RHOB|nr:aminopeptidase [Pseudoroseicyclus tamaricis]NDV02506.1 aminopeptidase [Pseudoroseicyclus tamaricis]